MFWIRAISYVAGMADDHVRRDITEMKLPGDTVGRQPFDSIVILNRAVSLIVSVPGPLPAPTSFDDSFPEALLERLSCMADEEAIACAVPPTVSVRATLTPLKFDPAHGTYANYASSIPYSRPSECLLRGGSNEMIGSHATRLATRIYQGIGILRAASEHPRHVTSVVRAVVLSADLAVSCNVNARGPQPAAIRLIHFRPESPFKRRVDLYSHSIVSLTHRLP